MERNFQRSEMDLLEKCNSSTSESQTNSSIGFECNICLDVVQDPVVTFCGHLYCWPCIYQWISFHHASPENPNQQEPQCPVCKAEVSQKTLIPLYGRGQKASKNEALDSGPVIPHRPTSPRSGNDTLMPAQHLHHGRVIIPMVGIGGVTMHLADSMIGMLQEMVCAGIFGNNSNNTQSTLHAYPNSYRLAGNLSPRLRRHVMQADKSLSRICFFLCCCVCFVSSLVLKYIRFCSYFFAPWPYM